MEIMKRFLLFVILLGGCSSTPGCKSGYYIEPVYESGPTKKYYVVMIDIGCNRTVQTSPLSLDDAKETANKLTQDMEGKWK